MDNYDPRKDPANWEVCRICKGTGTRTMPVPTDPNWKPVEGECNGCTWHVYDENDQPKKDENGKLLLVPHVEGKPGWTVKFGFEPHDGDVVPVSGLTEPYYVPYAIVTPDGKWHEKGRMGWFGAGSDEKEDEEWETEARKLIAQYKEGHTAVMVDCHV